MNTNKSSSVGPEDFEIALGIMHFENFEKRLAFSIFLY